MRLDYLDVMKAMAIIAVVLYHTGYMTYGYLGVDVFLVINGYLLAKGFSSLNSIGGGCKFLIKRVLRLWPVVVAASAVCLIWGAYWMLPYNYFDLSQHVIASNLFANNILMSIKSADYWNTLNEYKPLMHMWYLGVVVQFYVFFAILLILMKKVVRSKKDITIYVIGICSVLSLVLYLLPTFTVSQKFYYLPFRVFEFGAGMWLALYIRDKSFKMYERKSLMTLLSVLIYAALLVLLFVNSAFVPSAVRLLMTVLLSSMLLFTLPHVTARFNALFSNKALAAVGRWSFSIYVWHQIVLAFCRYSFTSEINAPLFVLLMLITLVLSLLSYYFIEQPVARIMTRAGGMKKVMVPTAVSLVMVLAPSFYLNARSGVIRDVPELDTYKESAFSRMHIAYNESAHRFNKDFESVDKQHWLVVGDSYGRDFVNILNEAGVSEMVELSYIIRDGNYNETEMMRMVDSDMIFYCMTVSPGLTGIDKFIPLLDSLGVGTNNLMFVGTKLFGYSCGQVYSHRHDDDYYNLSLEIDKSYFTENEKYKKEWGDHYIDLITPVAIGDNRVRVFSDDHKIISQDCEHLTQGGARYYAKLLNPLFIERIHKIEAVEDGD